MSRLAALAVTGLLATGAAAALPAAAQTAIHDPAKIESGQFTVEPGHTIVTFGVSHMGFSTYYGRLSQASGTLSLDPKQPAATRFAITVPVASVSTTSDKLNEELKSADWLDAGKFPQATFTSTSVVPNGHGSATVTGQLTLHGVTKPVILRAKFVGGGINPLDHKYTVGFDLVGTIDRSAFGVTKYLPLIGDQVTLTIAAAFEKQG